MRPCCSRIKYALPDEFIFYPAATWPHKNHIKLLEAISILRKKYVFEKKLVLIGIPMNNHSRIMDTVKRLNLRKQVIFLHFVPFSDLPVIYNLSTIIVFPSLFEGFGIPLIEAMNVGLPIACSDRTSIPEIVDDAGIYFNPDSAEDIAEKIFLLWQDNDMKRELIRKGFGRAGLSKWKETVEKTVTAYNLAANLVR
jgi:glycosyltransferase involved in cell wall biosynthesis